MCFIWGLGGIFARTKGNFCQLHWLLQDIHPPLLEVLQLEESWAAHTMFINLALTE